MPIPPTPNPKPSVPASPPATKPTAIGDTGPAQPLSTTPPSVKPIPKSTLWSKATQGIGLNDIVTMATKIANVARQAVDDNQGPNAMRFSFPGTFAGEKYQFDGAIHLRKTGDHLLTLNNPTDKMPIYQVVFNLPGNNANPIVKSVKLTNSTRKDELNIVGNSETGYVIEDKDSQEFQLNLPSGEDLERTEPQT